MPMQQETSTWYAVYTKARWEKKVADLLSRRRVENFCPLNRIVRQWADRKKTIYEPLFSSYVFVHATEAEHLVIKQTEGIINFVYWLGRPAVIKDEEIKAIGEFLEDYENIKLEKINVNITDKVRIIHGPLANREGNVLEVKRNTVRLSLPSLGYDMIAEVSKSRIEVLDLAHLPYATSATMYNAKVG
jgi:transcription antitermination factor NusG